MCKYMSVDFFISSKQLLTPIAFLTPRHRNDKAARWAKSKRPKKYRLSDINKTPKVYAIHSYEKPAEFTISDAPAKPITKDE